MAITKAYSKWIEARYPTPESAHLACVQATLDMVACFPELTRVKGHVYTSEGYYRPHWWCLDPEGNIIDPTGHQFGPGGPVKYDEHEGEEPHGKCLDCGNLLYREQGDTSHLCRGCVNNQGVDHPPITLGF